MYHSPVDFSFYVFHGKFVNEIIDLFLDTNDHFFAPCQETPSRNSCLPRPVVAYILCLAFPRQADS